MRVIPRRDGLHLPPMSPTLAGLLVLLLASGAARVTATTPAATTVMTAPRPRPATAADVLAAVKAAKGRVVLINAWATWCIPCRQEMPDLLRMRRELKDKGFELILVTADFESALDGSQAFLASHGVDFPTLHKKQRDQEFIDGLDPSWTGALPFTMLFDRTGNRSASWEGRETLDQLRARVLPLLETKGTQK